ncbi:MAG: beta-ketoacyl-ACP reductase [Paracoccaceae bacterium]|tara:strand:- start:48 stop:782 length:735 start_codon:yes stop_codon:yes gene_type:complete
MFDLSGKKVLITGASGGIGRELSKSFLELGAKIIISGTDSNRLNSLKEDLYQECEVYKCDLSNANDINALTANLDRSGGIDILINNAGKTEDNLLMRMSDEQWENIMLINLTSVMKLTRGIIRGMIKKRWGRVINITSIVALTGNPGQSNYVASKSGLIGFSKSLALEVASRGITVNCIAPGFIKTNMTDALNENQINSILNRIPMNRIGLPMEICSSAVYLASSSSNYITGQTIHVNGGMFMS